MPLRRYLREIQDLLDSFPAITTYSLSFDERSPHAAFLQGRVAFIDGSALHFKEFLLADPEVRKLKYGYHWSAEDGLLRFRYDNSNDPAARHLMTFPHHKHTSSGIEEAQGPALSAVLAEISSLLSRS